MNKDQMLDFINEHAYHPTMRPFGITLKGRTAEERYEELQAKLAERAAQNAAMKAAMMARYV
jgi:hypothetical protein